MNLAKRAVIQLKSTYDGRAWHGKPVRRLVEEVDPAKAYAHPIEGSMSIAEMFAHIAAWMEIVERRLRGEVFEVTPEMDFPTVDGVVWEDLLARADAAQSRLVETVRAMSDEDFDRMVPNQQYSNDFMIHGLIHHSTYHAAQIAVLKKLG